MYALPWILALTLTTLHCLEAAPTGALSQNDKKFDHNVKSIIKNIEELKSPYCDKDAEFYSPPVGDDKECTSAYLTCYTEELKRVQHECPVMNKSTKEEFIAVPVTIEFIEEVQQKMANTDLSGGQNCICEQNPSSYKDFLQGLERMVQRTASNVS